MPNGMTALDRSSHELSNLSLTQLEGTLIAANLLLDAWRTTNFSGFDRLPERPTRFERNSIWM